MTPEQRARQNIDAQLEAAGWIVQDYQTRNLNAGPGIAVREFPLVQGFADYLLFVDKRSIGVLEAKPEGTPLSGVEIQSRTYSQRLPATLQASSWGLIFLYDSNGKQTQCTDLRDPAPRALAFISPKPCAHGPKRQPRCANACAIWSCNIRSAL
jgi:type I restriction enzyme R subunit